jgi:hypothetical protein
MRTQTFKIISFVEFKKLVAIQLLRNYERMSLDTIVDDLLTEGLSKLDKDNLGKSLKGMNFQVYLDPVFVDADSEFCWMVSGTDAIVVKKGLISEDKLISFDI